MNFGNTLKELREAKNITQSELAEYLQVSRPTVAGYETKNRQPDFEKLEKLADYFQVSIDHLISGTKSVNVNIRVTSPLNEKSLEKDMMTAFRKLSVESKQDTLKYIELLQLRDASKKKH